MLDLKNVLFPTDFSPCANQALDYASLMAEQFDAQLHLLNALVVLPDRTGDFERRPEELALLDRLEDEAIALLRDLEKRDSLDLVDTKVACKRGYSPGEVILDHAQEIRADLLVVGTHGRRGPRRWLLGSVTEEILRSADCPVLVVRERKEGQHLEPIRQILVPVDFTDGSLAALNFAKEVARTYEAKLVLIHVVDLPMVKSLYGQPLVADMTEIEPRVRQHLSELAAEAALAEDEFELVVESGSAAAAVVDYAATHKIGLTVMPALSRRRAGLLGRTTDGVVRRTTCPVIALPPAALVS